MASLTRKLITSLAAVCAAGAPSALPEATTAAQPAAELLRTAEAAAAQVTSCPATADDLASEAVLRILERHPHVLELEDGRRRAYVRRTVRNTYWDELRRNGHLLRLNEGDEGEAGPDGWTGATNGDGSAESAALEFREQLRPSDRELLDHLLEGGRERKIAAATGRTRHDVRTGLTRIRLAAADYFEV